MAYFACFVVRSDDELYAVAEPVLSPLRCCNIPHRLCAKAHQRGEELIIKIEFDDECDLAKALLICPGQTSCV